MGKHCNNCNKTDDCKMKESCQNMGHSYCRFYECNGTTNSNKTKLKEFEKAARPLIKWLCENEHPHVTALITPTSCELLEGKCASLKIYDYIQD